MVNAPMIYINLISAWLIVILAVIGYVYTLRKTGSGWAFWLIFAVAWAFLGISHIFTFVGTAASVWYMTALRVAGYLFMIIATISLIIKTKYF